MPDLIYFGEAPQLAVQDVTISGQTVFGPHPAAEGEVGQFFDKPPADGGVEVTDVYRPYDPNTGDYATVPVQRPPLRPDGIPVRCLVPDTYPVLYDAGGLAITPWPQVVGAELIDTGQSVAYLYQADDGSWVDIDGNPVTTRPDVPVVFARVTVAGTTLPSFLLPTDMGLVAAHGTVIPDEGNPPVITGPAPVTDVARIVGPPAEFPYVDTSWQPPTNAGGSPITGYQTAIGSQIVAAALPWDQRSYRFNGLEAGHKYGTASDATRPPLRIRAFNTPTVGAASNVGAWADVPDFSTSAFTPPDDSGGTTSSAPMAPPRRVVSIYHMLWSNSPNGSLSTVPTATNLIHLAFLQGTTLVGYGQEGSWENLRARVLEQRAAGRRVYLSTGGSKGTIDYSNRDGIINAIKNIRNNLGGGIPLDGWDIDAEGPAVNGRGSDGKFHIVYITEQLRAAFGPNFHCSMAPNGSYIDQYQPVAVALHKGAPQYGGGEPGLLAYMGQQFYEWEAGSWSTWKSAALSRMQSAMAVLPADKYYVGNMMKSCPDAKMSARAYWSLAEISEFLDEAHGRWPALAGAYLWMNGDPNRHAWADLVKSKIDAWG